MTWWELETRALIPGDPAGVEDLSSNLKVTGESIATQATRLRGVNSDIWVGEAATQFAEHIKDTPAQLELLANRYDGVAAALKGYAEELRSSQTKVETAKTKAREAHASQLAANAAVQDAASTNDAASRSAASQNQAFPAEPPIMPSLTVLGPLQWRASDADRAMVEAESLREAAEGERDLAAGRCKRTIKGCIDDDLKDEGGLLGWTKRAFKKVAPYLAVIAAVVGIVALFIPGLNLIAIGLAVACLVVDSANYFVFHQGDLSDVLFDLVGLAAFAGALKAAKGARALQKADAARDVARVAKTGKAIKKAKSVKQLKRVAKNRLNMSPADLPQTRQVGRVRQVLKARQRADRVRAAAKLDKSSALLDQAWHPWRTMFADTRQLFTQPGRQLSKPAVLSEYSQQVLLLRSGDPGKLYGGLVGIDQGTGGRDVIKVIDDRQGPDVAEVDRAMADVPVGSTAPTAR